MPKKDFEDCVKKGGKVVKKQLKGGRYINICYDKKGKSHAGDIRVTKKNDNKKRKPKAKRNGNATEAQLQMLKAHFDERRN